MARRADGGGESRSTPRETPRGVRAVVVAGPPDAGADRLEAFAVGNGFPPGWAADMLADGAAATLALSDDHGPVAMAWATSRAFFVEEIAATIDPGAGLYLFGDFVAPAQRGRGLQRWLVAERLRGAGHACTIVHPSNPASVRSYERERFEVSARFTRYRWARRTWTACRTPPGVVKTFQCDRGDTITARWS